MSIKIEKQYLAFPKMLPNDLEDFMIFYPRKFPLIVAYYEEVAKEIANSPEKFREYGLWARDELFAGFEKIKECYDNGDQDDLEFLIDIDQRFNKLICYRFWIVNYLFADGPLHDYFVDNVRSFIHKFVDIGDNVEEFEARVATIQRDLLQSDYADLYLKQSLSGAKLLRLAKENLSMQKTVDKVAKLIDDDPQKNYKEINLLWDNFVKQVKEAKGELLSELKIPLSQAKMRGSMIHVYNMLTHSVEFREDNDKLVLRHDMMRNKINKIQAIAKQELTSDEFDLFKLSYEQIRNFTEYKDVMGKIDDYLLPLWFGIHDKIRNMLISKGIDVPIEPTGHAAMFYFYVWYLPDNLKVKILNIDNTPFDLKTI